jgi:spermidine synthase
VIEPEITLSEEAGVRYLHFGSPWIQGAMRIRRPWDIVIDYVAQMQSWLLFLEPPKRILQIGVGAAALTKHSYRFFPKSEIVVVEASAAVVSAARQFFALPENDSRLKVVVEDGAAYLQSLCATRGSVESDSAKGISAKGSSAKGKLGQAFGVVQVDVYDQEAKGPVLDSLSFYQNCYDTLSDTGILSVNLFGEASSFTKNLARIHEVFGGRVLAWPAVDAGNIVVLAFKGPPLNVAWTKLFERAQVLDQAYDLSAPKWLRSLRRQPIHSRASTTHLSL